MGRLTFQRLNFRDRNIYIPVGDDLRFSDELVGRRGSVAAKLRNTLYDSWCQFSREHFDNVPDDANNEEMLPNFLSAYVLLLWQFKKARKRSRSAVKYAISIRINAYDEVFQVWKIIAQLWCDRYLPTPDFEDKLINVALNLGSIRRELKLIKNNQMNAGEYLVERELHQLKAVSIRHSENHALRDEVYVWADKNIKPSMTLDDAASEVAGKVVPLKWRTVRSHLTEWKKLRSAGTP